MKSTKINIIATDTQCLTCSRSGIHSLDRQGRNGIKSRSIGKGCLLPTRCGLAKRYCGGKNNASRRKAERNVRRRHRFYGELFRLIETQYAKALIDKCHVSYKVSGNKLAARSTTLLRSRLSNALSSSRGDGFRGDCKCDVAVVFA